jgi:hypothetical protein
LPAATLLRAAGEEPATIGQIVAGTPGVRYV